MGELKYFKQIEKERNIKSRILRTWRLRGMKAVRLSEGFATTDEWLNEWIKELAEQPVSEEIVVSTVKKPKYKPLPPKRIMQENKVY